MPFVFFDGLNVAAALLKRPRTPPANNPAMDYQTADSDHVLKRSRPFGISDEVCNYCFFPVFNSVALTTGSISRNFLLIGLSMYSSFHASNIQLYVFKVGFVA